MNQVKPSYIFRSGSRLRRSLSSACGSNNDDKVSQIRPVSLFTYYTPKSSGVKEEVTTSDDCDAEETLDTIDENKFSSKIEQDTDCYILQIGCNNWVGRLELIYKLLQKSRKNRPVKILVQTNVK